MKALVYTGERSMAFQEAAEPEPGDGEALVRVEASGICGSDMHAWLGHDERRPAPLILGHEAAGTVIAGPLEGQRVTINPLVNCGTCPACVEGRENLCPERRIISMPPKEGAFAERVVMRAANLVPVPDSADIRHAALAEPLAVCWHAATLGARALFGDLAEARCLVQGGGAIGLGSALSLRALGVGEITVAEPNPLRVPVLEAEGFRVVSPEAVTGPFDLIMDAVGIAATRAAASALVMPGGVIVHIGLGDAQDGLDLRRMTLQEITFIGSYTYTAAEFRDTAAGIFDGRFGTLDWIEDRALAGGAGAFEAIHAGNIASPKILLRP